ncbi:Nucb2 [Anthophora quadrimaculata]
MKYFLFFLLICVLAQLSVAPPVNQKNKDAKDEVEEVEEMEDVEYRRYLLEVVQVLENDPEFHAKLANANAADLRTGKIAEELQFVNHNVRTKLDEIKRMELERLRHLATKENELKNGLDTDHLKIPEHLDHTNTHTFEIQDLQKLIAKTTKDLAKAERRRQEEFKQHEMQRKYEEQEKLKQMDDAERKKYEEELHAIKEKQKKHEPVHHPGSKQQLEEVWEKQDHMENEEFNPKTFFFFHDIDGNGVWDQDEVKALFLKELDKLYAQGAPQSDLLKRAEEMERMREHVFNEADLNKDGLLSYEEFLEQTKKPDFQQDEGWQGLDEQQIYTEEEFEAFKRHQQEEMQKMIAKGMLPPQPGSIPAHPEPFPPQFGNGPVAPGVVPPQVHQQQFQGQYHEQPQGVVPQQGHHGQVPQQQPQYHHELPQQQQQFQQVPVNQQYQQVPIPQHQVPIQQLQAGQVPPVQQYQGQPLVQQQGQVPAQHGQPQPPNFQQQQNIVNQVPQSAQSSGTQQQQQQQQQQHNPSQSNPQPAQPPMQQEINRNQIPTAEKV